MAFLDGWLDEPEAAIARMAKAFYLLTYLFLAIFLVQMVSFALHGSQVLHAGDVIAPMVNLFLSLTMFLLALDGRRSYKSIKAKRSDSESAESRPIG